MRCSRECGIGRISALLATVLLCVGFTAMAAERNEAGAVPDSVSKAMAAGEYAKAAEQLLEIVKKEPRNAQAHYLLGKTCNHLRQYRRAEMALAVAVRLGLRTPDVQREVGIALAGLRSYELAIERLRRARPDDARAAYARALVALKLGLEDESKSALEIAMRDPKYRARVQRLVGAARPSLPLRLPQEADRKWRLQLGLTAGYDDNVTLRADEAIRDPSERAGKNSWLATLSLNAGYELWTDGTKTLEAQGAFSDTRYEALERWDVTHASLGLALSRRTPNWIASISPSAQRMWVDHNVYRTRLVVPMNAERRLASWCSFGGTYRVDIEEYHFHPDLHEDLDGLRHHVDIGPRFWTPGGRVSFRIAGTWDASQATGEYMQYRALGGSAGMQVRLHEKWKLGTFLSYRHPRYEHRTPRHPTRPIKARRDWETYFHAELAYDVAPKHQIALTYWHLNNSSNIPRFYEYDQDHVAVSYRYSF